MSSSSQNDSRDLIRKVLAEVSPGDCLEASGPLLMAIVFGYVLYGLQVPVNFLVVYGIGLVYWPLYELFGLLVEQGLNGIFRARPLAQWEKFRNGLLPLLLGAVMIGLFYFGQWFWLVIFAHCLGFLLGLPDETRQNKGCRQGIATAVLLLTVLVLVISGLPASLSGMFQFPNVRGALIYLPGMLIIGIGYYLSMAVLIIVQRAIRKALG